MSGTPNYHYFLRDHLCNTRVVVNQSNTLVQQTAYYPFGMAFSKGGSADNKYLYNGKELQEDVIGNGVLDWYDYGARMYDPTLGRWHSIDAMYDHHFGWSPYVYVLNNPIQNIDLYGYTDWKTVGSGIAVTAGGLTSTIGGIGAAITPTGAGQVGGAALISAGIPSIGLGIIIEGVRDNGNGQNIPGGLGEAGGMMYDQAKSDGGTAGRQIGTLVDFGVNVSGGASTLTEKVVVGALAIDLIGSVFSTQENNSGIGISDTNNTSAKSDNTRVIPSSSSERPIDFTGKHDIDESLVKEFFNK
ncbi:hypothetical protein CDL62_05525 [Alkalitalea saponilacus]|nr:hypothetical protein CDL62_05525 [Alkalitalea saponilacus]